MSCPVVMRGIGMPPLVNARRGMPMVCAVGTSHGDHLGVINALPLHSCALFDASGSLTRVMAGTDRALIRSFSMQVGVTRLTEQVVQSDTISHARAARQRFGWRNALGAAIGRPASIDASSLPTRR